MWGGAGAADDPADSVFPAADRLSFARFSVCRFGSLLVGFGSYFLGGVNPRDIDIAVLCSTDADGMVERIRSVLPQALVDRADTYSPQGVAGPLHVTVVPANPISEKEAAFLSALKQGVLFG